MVWYDGYLYVVVDLCLCQMEINIIVVFWDNLNMCWVVNYIIDWNQIVNIVVEGVMILFRMMFVEYGLMVLFIDVVVEVGYGLLLIVDVVVGQVFIEVEGWICNGDYYEKDGEMLSVVIYVNLVLIEYIWIIDMIVE